MLLVSNLHSGRNQCKVSDKIVRLPWTRFMIARKLDDTATNNPGHLSEQWRNIKKLIIIIIIIIIIINQGLTLKSKNKVRETF